MRAYKKYLKKDISLLVLIFILGATVRIWNIQNNPPGFFCDEASIGYNAYKILTTGKDEHGVAFPIFFRAFGEYKSPVNIYSAVPFIAIFGLNEFSTRLFAAVYGTLSLGAIYLLAKELFNKKVATFSMLLLAISPWHIHISRIAFENISYVFWLTLSVALFLKGIKKENWLITSSVSFAITAYTYTPARIVAPAVFVFLLTLYSQKIFKTQLKRKGVISVVLFISLLIPLSNAILNGNALSRWNQVSIFSTKLNIAEISSHIAKAYFNYFSPTFLFLKGDIDFPGQLITRHSVRGMGQLYIFQAPLILLGIHMLINKYDKYKHTFLLLVFWLIIYPATSALTANANPQSTRGIIGIVPFTIISSLGLNKIITYAKKVRIANKPKLLFAITIFISLSFMRFLLLFKNYPNYSASFWGWQYGPRLVMQYFLKEKDNYNQLCLEGKFNAPYIFIKFYDPKNTCQGKCQICEIDSYNLGQKRLFAISDETYQRLHNNKTSSYKTIEIIKYPNGKPAFYLGTLNNY